METKGLTALRISLASPETIRSWSYGEVLKPETIIIAASAQRKTGCFVRRFLVQPVIGSVIVESTRIFVTRGLYAISVE